jgi:hypothetical protein
MLPFRAIELIREFSKPVTRPNWREGTPHSVIFYQSTFMKSIITEIKYELDLIRYNKYNKIYTDIIKRTFTNILDYTGTNYIHEYGEELIECVSYNLVKGSYINFYHHARNFLVKTIHS